MRIINNINRLNLLMINRKFLLKKMIVKCHPLIIDLILILILWYQSEEQK